MSSEKRIRIEAKSYLANSNWPPAIGVCVVVLFAPIISMLISGLISSVINLAISQSLIQDNERLQSNGNYIISCLFFLSLVIMSPIYLGVKRYFYTVAHNESKSAYEVFHYFTTAERYCQALIFNLSLLLRSFLWFILCISPSILLISLFPVNTEEPMLISVIAISLLLPAGFVISLIVCTRYFLAPYIFLFNNDAKKALSYSAKGMKKLNLSVWVLYLTFVPWFLLCFFVLPLMYVLPYFETSCAVSAKWILNMRTEKSTDTEDAVKC